MSLRPHPVDPHIMATGAHSPEIHHPQPFRPPQLQLQRRVSISTGDDVTEIQESPTWRHYVPASADATTEKVAPSVAGNDTNTGNSAHRSPSAPPAFNHPPPPPPPTTIHPILAVRSILRARSSMRLAWDVRFSPDFPSPPMRNNHRNNTGTPSAITAVNQGRPRSNTQPRTDLDIVSELSARLNNGQSTIHSPTGTGTGIGSMTGTSSEPLASHPLAQEPATTPPLPRMLIICRDHDLFPYLIPVYARNPEIGCTVLDVVRGIYNALEVDRRIDRLGEKTLFVCIGRDEALARRRLPFREELWSEVFVLTLSKRNQRRVEA